jgi:hypothetical protein
MECYSFELINFNRGYYDKSIDITYIIHLENNGRYDSIIEQLNYFQPTKKVFICINKGYKKCIKSEYINSSCTDLVDAYINIFKHSRLNNFKNVLIFEDDFLFSPKILIPTNIDTINMFLNKHRDEKFVYFLGNLPTLKMPYSKNTMILLIGMGTHACFYSDKCIEAILNDNYVKIKDWDEYLRKFRRYIYNIPLCYQLFTETENYNNWNDSLTTKIAKKIIKMNNLDVQTEPGYSNMYFWSTLSFYVIIFLIVIIPVSILIVIKRSRK